MVADWHSDSKIVRTVEEEKEAEHVETRDYFFERIGEAVPLKPNSFLFDLQNPPSVPLAVSERFSLIFVAHSTGFYVAKTNDVIKSAKEWKEGVGGCSVQELNIVDVSVGSVYILALSADSSIIAASVGGDIHFFSVKSLLAKERKPFFSCSIGSSAVKDIRWSKQTKISFLILSRGGSLYKGTLEERLEHVMDDVNAVEWSVDDKFLAVARNNALDIFSPELKERLGILLELKLKMNEINALRVDCIRWIRSDYIMLGCFEQSPDSREENYIIRAIMSKNGEEITDASSKLVLLCFSDLFMCTVDDIVPFGSGPHLMTSYLETRQLAVIANRKNIDQHIMLVGWLQEGDEPAVIDIERDNWLPRIELQENGDDNLLLGLCVDRTFASENIQVKVGDEELKELSPDCLILCLTHDGKLTMFHFASISGDSGLPQNVGVTYDEDENTSGFRSSDLGAFSSEQEAVKVERFNLDLCSREACKDEIGSNECDNFLMQNHQKEFDANKFNTPLPDVDQTLMKGRIPGRKEDQIFKAGNCVEPNSSTNANKEFGCQQSEHVVKECLSRLPIKSYIADSPHENAHDISQAEKANLVGVTSGSDHTSRKQLSSSSYLPDTEKLQSTSNHGNEVSRRFGYTVLQNGSDQPDLSKVFTVSHQCESTCPSLSPFRFLEGHKSDRNFCVDTLKGSSSLSISNSVTIKPVSGIQGSSTLTSINKMGSGSHSMEVSPLSRPRSGKALDHSVLPSPSQHVNFEPRLSKKYGNMKDMATELDRLIDSIEVGGFRDTCAGFESNLLENLKALCHRCAVWKSITDEQVEDIQHLLHNTVHVLTRKTYMEGIVKQTTDRQYWDIWDCQKLSSELELKRQNMMIISQDLINQVIELAKHFNALEMKSYSESSGVKLGRRSLRKESAASRQIQSLHAVHNALNSQLAAAEQLSDCLSRQMAELSITSPLVEVGIKNQLFEMIGIPYEGDRQGSSHIREAIDAPKDVAGSVSSVSTAMKTECRSNRSGLNNHEPETARRRRESLDQNWANFEPFRTTVKRMLEGHDNLNVLRSSECTDFCSSNSRVSAISHSEEHISNGLEDGSKNVASESLSNSLIMWTKDLPQPLLSAAEQTPAKQTLEGGHLRALSSHFFPNSLPHMDVGVKKEVLQSIGQQHDPKMTHIKSNEFVSLKERYSTPQPEVELNQSKLRFESAPGFAFSFSKDSGEMPACDSSKESASAKPGGGIIKSSLFGFPGSSIYGQPATPVQIQISEALTSSSPLFVPHSSSSPVSSNTSLLKSSSSLSTSAVQSTVTILLDNASLSGGSKYIDDTMRKVPQSTSSAFSATSSASSLNCLLSKSYEMVASSSSCRASSPSSSSINSALKSAEHQSHAGKVDAGLLMLSNASSESDEIVSPCFVESSIDSMKRTGQRLPSLDEAGAENQEKPSELVSSQGQLGWNILSSEVTLDKVSSTELTSGSGMSSNLTVKSQSDKQSGGHTDTNNNSSSTLSGSDVGVAQSQEDEMEEEEVSDTVDLSLGSLGGLGGIGIVSGPSSSTAYGPNPFGGPFGMTATANNGLTSTSSPTSLTIRSGEIFRPASFSFQPFQSQPPNVVPRLSGAPEARPGTGSGFGQPGQIGSGIHALGSVLGTFGQSRQLGGGVSGSLPSAFGAQFVTGFNNITAATSGFAGASSVKGFAGVAAPGGGFTGVGGGSGFAGIGGGGGGFGGISAPSGGSGAAASGGSGFGAFGNKGGSGFSAFAGSGVGGTRPPSELFTQMRK